MAPVGTVSDVFGHDHVRLDLARSVQRGELPGSLLIHGPPGVGRQTVARWLARLLVCERPGPTEPCGQCTGCHLALDFQHPDIHWFFPLPRPKGASGPDKLADALEAARFEALDEWRQNPLYQPPDDEPRGLYLAQVRTIRRLGATRPAMAARQVFIIGDAELLVPQEASEEAANALLKILEEPAPETTFILTATEPEALLPTVRSRVLPVRLRSFDDRAVADFLEQRAGANPTTARLLARLGRGSIGRALAFHSPDGSTARAEQIRRQAMVWLEAALDPQPVRRYQAAHAQRPVGARGTFGDTLDALELWLRDLAAVAAGAPDQAADPDSVPHLSTLAATLRGDRLPDAIEAVEAARDGGRINANPQLTLACLLHDLATTLRP
jgi:DNA polymerase III subunit delta'